MVFIGMLLLLFLLKKPARGGPRGPMH